jgi:hypothetical protein
VRSDKGIARRLRLIEERLEERPAGERFASNERLRQHHCTVASFLNQFEDMWDLAFRVDPIDASPEELARSEEEWCNSAWEHIEASGDPQLIESWEYIRTHEFE